VPEAGLPPVAVQEKVYGDVPPVALAVQDTATPTVPLAGQLIVTATGNGLIVTVADALAVAAFASVTVTEIVLLPLVEYVVLKLEPVPLAGLPPVAVQANVYGEVPPEPVAVQDTALLTVPEVGQLIVTANGEAGPIVTVADLEFVAALPSVTVTDIVLLPFVE